MLSAHVVAALQARQEKNSKVFNIPIATFSVQMCRGGIAGKEQLEKRLSDRTTARLVDRNIGAHDPNK